MCTPCSASGLQHRVPEPVPSLETQHQQVKGRFGADTTTVIYRQMKSNGVWRVNGNTPSYGRRKEKRRWTPTWVVAQDTWASPNSLETHLVRKWGDIGHQQAVGKRIIQIQKHLLSFIHTLLVNILRCVRLHIKRKYYYPQTCQTLRRKDLIYHLCHWSLSGSSEGAQHQTGRHRVVQQDVWWTTPGVWPTGAVHGPCMETQISASDARHHPIINEIFALRMICVHLLRCRNLKIMMLDAIHGYFDNTFLIYSTRLWLLVESSSKRLAWRRKMYGKTTSDQWWYADDMHKDNSGDDTKMNQMTCIMLQKSLSC